MTIRRKNVNFIKYVKKKREENNRWEEKAKEAKKENDVWVIVNRERRRRKWINENIEMGEWKKHEVVRRNGEQSKEREREGGKKRRR